MLDWDDLRYFINAVRAGNYTSAADRLKVNRTTVGRRIGQLENRLGISLFEQTPSGYRPTPAGRVVLEAAEQVEREMERMTGRLATPEERMAATVRVAISGEIGTEFMPELLAFRKSAPEIKLELLTARDAINSLLQRKADVGICLVPYKPEHLRGQRVGELSQALYAARRYLAGLKPVHEFAHHEWIGWGKEMTHSAGARWMKANLPDTVRISAEVNSWDAFKEAILCGLGIGHMWSFVADREPELVRIREPEADLALELWLLVREDVPPDANTNALMSFLAPTLGERIQSR
jgi:DNA-binding transcriptional LysR family regulator